MKTLLLALMLNLAFNIQAQKKWYVPDKSDIPVLIFEGVAGVADGFNQAIAFKKFGAGNEFWDYKTSWQNKYRNWPTDKREAFPGSTTIFVMFTDGYHLTRGVGRWSHAAAIGFSIDDLKTKDRWKVLLRKAVLSWAANRIAFTATYRLL